MSVVWLTVAEIVTQLESAGNVPGAASPLLMSSDRSLQTSILGKAEVATLHAAHPIAVLPGFYLDYHDNTMPTNKGSIKLLASLVAI